MTAFEQFFASDFPKRLDALKGDHTALGNGIPIAEASWDRKAAYLLWQALGRPGEAHIDDDLLDILG